MDPGSHCLAGGVKPGGQPLRVQAAWPWREQEHQLQPSIQRDPSLHMMGRSGLVWPEEDPLSGRHSLRVQAARPLLHWQVLQPSGAVHHDPSSHILSGWR